MTDYTAKKMTDFSSKLAADLAPIIGTESLPATESAVRPSLAERARLRQDLQAVRRQQNIERIVELATAEVPAEISEEAASEDWLNLFFEFAGDVSDETAQQVWARVLALRIANADAVFKRTLVQLRNLDQWELNAFSDYCAFAFALESGWRFVFEEALTRREIWGYVQGNDYTQHFINIGLLSPELSVMRPRSSRGMRIRYQQNQYELAASRKQQDEQGEDTDPSFGYRKFTPAGQQLAGAVRPKTYNGYARNLIKVLDSEWNVRFNLLETETAAAG